MVLVAGNKETKTPRALSETLSDLKHGTDY